MKPHDAIDLDSPYVLDAAQIAHYHERGYVKLRNVLSPQALAYYGDEITRQVFALNTNTKPMHERTTYQKAFQQVMNLWTKSEVVKEFSFSKRLARIAAELMGVRGVRMYHDQALYKEPGGGITPWHADQYYWPMGNSNCCTAWIPLQATPIELGALTFAVASHRFEHGRALEISDESEAKLQKALTEQNLAVDESAFELGEVSFHSGWTFHRAGPNQSNRSRAVMTIIYMEDGMRLAEPVNENQKGDWRYWMSGTKIGEKVQTPLNPVLYSADPPRRV
jgi:ectoine hydroxylase-related dioxygenase (phytanoyl-CoA dioxygenase family)